MQYIVALTGGIGSGKSTVAEAFAAKGAALIDADVIARQVVAPGSSALEAIHQRFGAAVIRPDGTLDRAALRARVFSAGGETAWLNGLLHPLIRHETEQQFAQMTGPYILWVVPLLVENALHTRANRVLVVDVPLDTQIARTRQRDDVSEEQVQRILAAQATRAQRLALADDIIDNSGRPDQLAERVAHLHQCYVALAASATRQDQLT